MTPMVTNALSLPFMDDSYDNDQPPQSQVQVGFVSEVDLVDEGYAPNPPLPGEGTQPTQNEDSIMALRETLNASFAAAASQSPGVGAIQALVGALQVGTRPTMDREQSERQSTPPKRELELGPRYVGSDTKAQYQHPDSPGSGKKTSSRGPKDRWRVLPQTGGRPTGPSSPVDKKFSFSSALVVSHPAPRALPTARARASLIEGSSPRWEV